MTQGSKLLAGNRAFEELGKVREDKAIACTLKDAG